MGKFSKLKCPVCGWEISAQVLDKSTDRHIVGMEFESNGYSGIRAVSPLRSPVELERALRDKEKGAFRKLIDRFLKVIEDWCNWGWLSRSEVLRVFGIYPLRGGLFYAERFEKVGRQATRRVVSSFDLMAGEEEELSSKEIPLIRRREVKTYEF